MLDKFRFPPERLSDYQKLHGKIIDIHGARGEEWFAKLPELLQKYETQWAITLLEPVKELSYNLVLHAINARDNSKVIFKAGVPNPDLSNEINTLKYFAGHGCVQILNYDHADGVMLIEQAIPGSMLSELTLNGRDEEAVHIFAGIVKMLHRESSIADPNLQNIPKLRDRLFEYQEVREAISSKQTEFGTFDLAILQHAENLFRKLLDSTQETVLLHGDLHHFNILSATRNHWLAIDPHGVIGDPIFETAAFMCNPYPKIVEVTDLKQLLTRRIDLLHDLLGYDKQRIKDWSIAHAILVAGQNIVTHGSEWQEWYQIGKILLEISNHIIA